MTFFFSHILGTCCSVPSNLANGGSFCYWPPFWDLTCSHLNYPFMIKACSFFVYFFIRKSWHPFNSGDESAGLPQHTLEYKDVESLALDSLTSNGFMWAERDESFPRLLFISIQWPWLDNARLFKHQCDWFPVWHFFHHPEYICIHLLLGGTIQCTSLSCCVSVEISLRLMKSFLSPQ